MNSTGNSEDVVEYGLRRVLVVMGVMLATLLETLDSTIVNVALPTIQGNLGASFPPWLQQRFGRRGYYITAILGFTVCSLACGLSTSIEELIAFRIIQGLFGGGLIATGTATLRDLFPQSLVAASQGLGAVGAFIGPTLGPTIGGILTDAYSWNWVFYLNVVPGIAAATILFFFLRDPEKPQKIPVDGIGLGFLALGLGGLQYVLNEGEQYDWLGDRNIVSGIGLAIVGIAIFVIWETRFARQPIVDCGSFGSARLPRAHRS